MDVVGKINIRVMVKVVMDEMAITKDSETTTTFIKITPRNGLPFYVISVVISDFYLARHDR